MLHSKLFRVIERRVSSTEFSATESLHPESSSLDPSGLPHTEPGRQFYRSQLGEALSVAGGGDVWQLGEALSSLGEALSSLGEAL